MEIKELPKKNEVLLQLEQYLERLFQDINLTEDDLIDIISEQKLNFEYSVLEYSFHYFNTKSEIKDLLKVEKDKFKIKNKTKSLKDFSIFPTEFISYNEIKHHYYPGSPLNNNKKYRQLVTKYYKIMDLLHAYRLGKNHLEKLLSTGMASKLQEKPKKPGKPKKNEEKKAFLNRDELVMLFQIMVKCNILPEKTKQIDISEFLSKIGGYSIEKTKQSFSSIEQKDKPGKLAAKLKLKQSIELIKASLE
jgi:hypothetical protein